MQMKEFLIEETGKLFYKELTLSGKCDFLEKVTSIVDNDAAEENQVLHVFV